jgi:hypothetical protein
MCFTEKTGVVPVPDDDYFEDRTVAAGRMAVSAA